jgi:hypothetical protein
MAYTSANLHCIQQAINGVSIWHHKSADATGDVDAAGFITDGGSRGMKLGDLVYHKDSTTDATAVTMHKVDSVSSTYPGAVNLSAGTVVGSATTGD